jgi:hypothetical protein
MPPSRVEDVSERSASTSTPSRIPVFLSQRPIFWGVCALAVVIGFYRIATFTPQPLDGYHTLRPVLNHWFDLFLRSYDNPGVAYESFRFLTLLALLIPPVLVTMNFAFVEGLIGLPHVVARVVCSRALLFGSIAAVTFLCRFPILLDYQMNPDEGQFLSAAHKLFYDPSFFHSVDCGTSGPLNIYPLMLPAALGISPDFTSGRILTILIALASFYCVYLSVHLLATDAIARVAILPLTAALLVFEHANLVHYSSEQVPVLLMSVALYVATRVLHRPLAHRAMLFLLGVLVSAAFFAKMQSTPIVFAIGAVAVLYVYATHHEGSWWRPAGLFAAGGLTLFALNAAICLMDGVWTNFWISYIVSNRKYADTTTNLVTELPWLFNFFVATPEFSYFLILVIGLVIVFFVQRPKSATPSDAARLPLLAGASCAGAALVLMLAMKVEIPAVVSYAAVLTCLTVPVYWLANLSHKRFGGDPVRWFGVLCAVAIAAAVFSVYRPHRPFPHYLYLLFPPVGAAMAWLLVRRSSDPSSPMRLALPLMFIVLSTTHSTYLWALRDPHTFRTIAASIRQPEGDYIRAITSQDGRIFVWGWTAEPYLSSGRVSPVRDYNMFYLFNGTEELNRYYRDRLMHDLSQSPPELIIEAVGPVSWAYSDRGAFTFERFPEVSQFVNSFYVHTVDAWGERFFMRHDLAAKAAAVKPKMCTPGAIRCVEMPRIWYQDAATTYAIDEQPAVQLPAHARIDVQFTPMGSQFVDATVFNNEPKASSFQGFRFYNIGGDRYHLILGLGSRWAVSKPIVLPSAQHVALVIERHDNDVRIRVNGAEAEAMQLDGPLVHSDGKIQVGSWLNGMCKFSGPIEFFEIVDLGAAAPAPAAGR